MYDEEENDFCLTKLEIRIIILTNIIADIAELALIGLIVFELVYTVYVPLKDVISTLWRC